MFTITGTPDELRTQLENIKQDYVDFFQEIFDLKIIDKKFWKTYPQKIINSIDTQLNNLDKGLEKHQQTHQTYIEGFTKHDSPYSDECATILQKHAELKSAHNSGNVEDVKRAKQEFMDAINDAVVASGSDEKIKKYFQALYPELQAEFPSWNFEFALEANKHGLGDIAKEIGEKYSSVDLLGMVNDGTGLS